MIIPISNTTNFKVYPSNLAFGRQSSCKVIPFNSFKNTDGEQQIPQIASKRLMNTIKITSKEGAETAEKRDNMAEEAYELFEALRFAEMLDYADEMDDESITITSYPSPYGYTTSVGHYDENGKLLSTAKYRRGELDEYTKLDENGIAAVEYEIMPSYLDKNYSVIRINKKDRDVFGDTDLILEIRDGKPVSLRSEHGFFSDKDLEDSYDAKIYFSRFDGRPIRYEEGFRLFQDGKMQIDRVLKENSFATNFIQHSDGDEEADIMIVFHPDKQGNSEEIASYITKFKRKENGSKSLDERIDFSKNGFVKRYQRKFVTNKDNYCVSGDEYTFENGQWHKTKMQ